jgi:hypothetical protein
VAIHTLLLFLQPFHCTVAIATTAAVAAAAFLRIVIAAVDIAGIAPLLFIVATQLFVLLRAFLVTTTTTAATIFGFLSVFFAIFFRYLLTMFSERERAMATSDRILATATTTLIWGAAVSPANTSTREVLLLLQSCVCRVGRCYATTIRVSAASIVTPGITYAGITFPTLCIVA